jgi:hypothetical protein
MGEEKGRIDANTFPPPVLAGSGSTGPLDASQPHVVAPRGKPQFSVKMAKRKPKPHSPLFVTLNTR